MTAGQIGIATLVFSGMPGICIALESFSTASLSLSRRLLVLQELAQPKVTHVKMMQLCLCQWLSNSDMLFQEFPSYQIAFKCTAIPVDVKQIEFWWLPARATPFKKYEAAQLLFLFKSCKKKLVLYKCRDLIIFLLWGSLCIKVVWERNTTRENFLYVFSDKGERFILAHRCSKAEAKFPSQWFHQKTPSIFSCSLSNMLELLLCHILCL